MAKAKRNIIKLIHEERIVNKIYFIREQKVMLDFDLAMLYEVETKALNQAVKRNAERFPEDFMFRLTSKEWLTMRSQIVTSSSQNTDSQANINMRSQTATSSQSKFIEQIENLKSHLGEHDVQLNSIYEAIENLLDDKVDKKVQEENWKNRKRIGFKN